MRFVPVKLRLADVAVFDEANERDALEFTPTCFSISFLQVTKDPDSLVNRNGFDLGEFADDLEVHARKILSRPFCPRPFFWRRRILYARPGSPSVFDSSSRGPRCRPRIWTPPWRFPRACRRVRES